MTTRGADGEAAGRKRLWAETLIAARFSLVGSVATLVHLSVVFALLSTTELPPLVANAMAFLVAFCTSFAGNYLWTFRAPGNPHQAILRFLVISVSAFLVNSLVLHCILQRHWVPPQFAAICSAAVVPVISYAASRFWGFQASEKWMRNLQAK